MILDIDTNNVFVLQKEFIEPYQKRRVQWGFGALSWVIYKRTYSRNGEEWWQTCKRVIEGMFSVQRLHCLQRKLPWDDSKATNFAEDAYDRMWKFKWTPPGRGLWIMGTRYMYEHGGAALNNCGFVSTRDLAQDYAAPFCWMFLRSMLGVGIGFDTLGRDCVRIVQPSLAQDIHLIADSREGWSEALRRLLSAYTGSGTFPAGWDYSAIRAKGKPLHSFGGIASGADPLRRMLETLTALYDTYIGRKADSTLIVDTMNIVGRCVVSGGIRRSAQIAFGQAADTTFLDLKQNPQKLAEYRWVSNNSIFAETGMDYDPMSKRAAVNGEPGVLWLDNARAYGRMKDAPNWADEAAAGSNPCVEQTLWDKELCCLVETYPAHHVDLNDYKATLRVAYQYAKTVTLVPTEDSSTNAVLLRNRRIGCSMTGIVQAINKLGYRNFFKWCDECYGFVQYLDKKYSDWLCVPRSIKMTSVKPSGSVSLLAGATPGVHWEHAPFYVRRVRVRDDSMLVGMCRKAGYHVEPDFYSDNTLVISFPVAIAHLERRRSAVQLWEKVDLAARMQYYWSDNQVSCTADFDPGREAEEIPRILRAYEDRLKAIIFLPSREHGYQQPPYEEITAAEYEGMIAKIKPLRGELEHEHEMEAKFCDGAACEIPVARRPADEFDE